MSFTKIADVYNRFNNLAVYDDWLDFTIDYLDGPGMKILDLGCGTGYFTQLLAPLSGQIIGVDIDPEMLKQAKAAYSMENLVFKEADMLDLSPLANDFDLITCFADTLCFLENLDQVQQAFKQMAQHLNKDGLLLFDVWTPYQITEGFDDFNYFDQDESAVLTWKSTTFPKELKVNHHLTVLSQIDGSSNYERNETVLVEKTYTLKEYKNALKLAGFSNIEIFVEYGEEEYDPANHPSPNRWFFVASK